MLGTLFGLVFTVIASFATISWFKNRYAFLDGKILNGLYFYHLALSFVYYLYAVFNPSDSILYYARIVNNNRGESWMDFFGTSTRFIEFIGYPFVKYLGFSYEGMMMLFSYFGFLGFCYFYVFVREHTRFSNKFFKYDLMTLILFLPNFHFWSGSFGKGSVMFLSLAMFFYAITKVKTRYIALIIAGLLAYYIRPHIFFVLGIATTAGFMFSSKRVSFMARVAFAVVAGGITVYIMNDVLAMVGLEDNFLEESANLSHRARELSKATSGVDISSYNPAMKLFTFLYRPLFVDAQGMLGLIVSFENLFYLIVTVMFFARGGLFFIIKGDYITKTAMVAFLLVSYALAQVSGNLGIAMRQKTQIMPFFMFVILYSFDQKKVSAYKQQWLAWYRRRKAVGGTP